MPKSQREYNEVPQSDVFDSKRYQVLCRYWGYPHTLVLSEQKFEKFAQMGGRFRISHLFGQICITKESLGSRNLLPKNKWGWRYIPISHDQDELFIHFRWLGNLGDALFLNHRADFVNVIYNYYGWPLLDIERIE